MRIKGFAGFEHSVDYVDEFSHRGADDDLAVFAVLFESAVKLRNDRIEPYGYHRRHVKALPEPCVAYLAETGLAFYGGAGERILRGKTHKGDYLSDALEFFEVERGEYDGDGRVALCGFRFAT